LLLRHPTIKGERRRTRAFGRYDLSLLGKVDSPIERENYTGVVLERQPR
jgi:hypothetical protein